MGYEYINVDSKHRNKHEKKSEIKVHLSSPILHAKSVRLIAFSAPNEFFNVIKGNNTITFVEYNLINGQTAEHPYTITPGLYSIDDLITQLNVDFSVNPVGGTTIVASRLANNKVQLVMSAATSQQRRVIIYYPKYTGDKNDPFFQSIAYRLGFYRDQVSDRKDSALITDAGGGNAVINYEGFQTSEANWILDTENNFLLWNSSSTLANLKTFNGQFIAFESLCSHLFIKSDLVKDFHSTVKDSANDIVFTTQRNILQKIDVDVNIHSYIHYRGNLTEAIVHSLSGQPISHFTIQLTDDHHNLFEGSAFKNFSCILMFETHDDLASTKLHEKVIENNQRSIFLASHNC